MITQKDPTTPTDGNVSSDHEAELISQLKRVQADSLNLERRLTQEIISARTHGQIELIRHLLPTIDTLERAFHHLTPEVRHSLEANQATKQWLQGITTTHSQLLATLAKLGYTPIDSDGQPFSPHLHEAISTVEETDQPDNIVATTVQTGWQGKDGQVIQPALVIVNKNKNENK